MTHREYEPIAIRPNRIVRIESEDSLPQAVGDRGHGHRRSRVAGVGLLDGIHGKSADGIDAGLIKLCVRHHGPLCRGVCLERYRQWFSPVIMSAISSTGLSDKPVVSGGESCSPQHQGHGVLVTACSWLSIATGSGDPNRRIRHRCSIHASHPQSHDA